MTGKEFSEIRKKLKITQEGMKIYTGYGRRAIQEWESSENIPLWAEKIILLLEEKLTIGLNNTNINDEIEITRLKKMIDRLLTDIDNLEHRLAQYEANKSKTGT